MAISPHHGQCAEVGRRRRPPRRLDGAPAPGAEQDDGDHQGAQLEEARGRHRPGPRARARWSWGRTAARTCGTRPTVPAEPLRRPRWQRGHSGPARPSSRTPPAISAIARARKKALATDPMIDVVRYDGEVDGGAAEQCHRRQPLPEVRGAPPGHGRAHPARGALRRRLLLPADVQPPAPDGHRPPGHHEVGDQEQAGAIAKGGQLEAQRRLVQLLHRLGGGRMVQVAHEVVLQGVVPGFTGGQREQSRPGCRPRQSAGPS